MLRDQGYRHRYRPGKAGRPRHPLHPGGRHHHPPFWWYRPGSGHLPAIDRAHGWHLGLRKSPGGRQPLLVYGGLRAGPAGRARRGGGGGGGGGTTGPQPASGLLGRQASRGSALPGGGRSSLEPGCGPAGPGARGCRRHPGRRWPAGPGCAAGRLGGFRRGPHGHPDARDGRTDCHPGHPR